MATGPTALFVAKPMPHTVLEAGLMLVVRRRSDLCGVDPDRCCASDRDRRQRAV